MPVPPNLVVNAGFNMKFIPTVDQQQSFISDAQSGVLAIYPDGHARAQNGWFVVKSFLPSNKNGAVLHCSIKANNITAWLRPSVIGYSQLAYHPKQLKAVGNVMR